MAGHGGSGRDGPPVRAATRYTREALLRLPGVSPLAEAPVVREFAVRLPVAAPVVVERMADAGFLAGIALDERVRPRTGTGCWWP